MLDAREDGFFRKIKNRRRGTKSLKMKIPPKKFDFLNFQSPRDKDPPKGVPPAKELPAKITLFLSFFEVVNNL